MFVQVTIYAETVGIFTRSIRARNAIYIPKEIVETLNLQQGMSVQVAVSSLVKKENQLVMIEVE
jgi:hypothetical protein